jgi:hypothetical protein
VQWKPEDLRYKREGEGGVGEAKIKREAQNFANNLLPLSKKFYIKSFVPLKQRVTEHSAFECLL